MTALVDVTLTGTDIGTGDVLSTMNSLGCLITMPLATSCLFQNMLIFWLMHDAEENYKLKVQSMHPMQHNPFDHLIVLVHSIHLYAVLLRDSFEVLLQL